MDGWIKRRDLKGLNAYHFNAYNIMQLRDTISELQQKWLINMDLHDWHQRGSFQIQISLGKMKQMNPKLFTKDEAN